MVTFNRQRKKIYILIMTVCNLPKFAQCLLQCIRLASLSRRCSPVLVLSRRTTGKYEQVKPWVTVFARRSAVICSSAYCCGGVELAVHLKVFSFVWINLLLELEDKWAPPSAIAVLSHVSCLCYNMYASSSLTTNVYNQYCVMTFFVMWWSYDTVWYTIWWLAMATL